MVAINSLPSVIVKQICKYAIGPELNPDRNYNYALKILAVCHNWRVEAMKLLYKDVYYNADMEYYNNLFGPLGSSYTSSAFGSSNIGLFTQTSNTTLAKRMTIKVGNVIYLVPMLADDNLKQLLSKYDWSGITELELCLGDVGNDDDDFSEIDEHMEDQSIQEQIIEFANTIHTNVPNVHTIKSTSLVQMPQIDKLVTKISSLYTNQLRVFNSNGWAHVPSFTSSFNGLTTFCYDYQEHGADFKLSVEFLTKLSEIYLINVPTDFCFELLISDANVQKDICIPNLTKLMISYIVDDDTTSNDLRSTDISKQHYYTLKRIIMPKLTKLHLVNLRYDSLKKFVTLTNYSTPMVTVLIMEDTFVDEQENISDTDVERVVNDFEYWCKNYLKANTEVSFSEYKPSKYNSIIAGRVASLYQHQLKLFELYCPLYTPVMQQSCLTVLIINASCVNSIKIVEDTAQSLQHLILNNTSSDFSWELLDLSANGKSITFNHLKTLSVCFKYAQLGSSSSVSHISNACIAGIPTGFIVNFPYLNCLNIEASSLYDIEKVVSPNVNVCSAVTTLIIKYTNQADIIEDSDGDSDSEKEDAGEDAVGTDSGVGGDAGLDGTTVLHNALSPEVSLDYTITKPCTNGSCIHRACHDKYSIHLANCLHDKFPNVKHINLDNDSQPINCNVFYSTLVDLYAYQLISLKARDVTLLNKINLMQQINCLDLTTLFDSSLDFLDTSDEKLNAYSSIDDNHCHWHNAIYKLFNINREQCSLELANLELVVLYNRSIDSNIDKNHSMNACSGCKLVKFQLILPKIRAIYMDITDRDYSFYNTELCFSLVYIINLYGTIGYLPMLAHRQKCYIKEKLVIKITTDMCDNDEDIFYKVTNSWFGKHVVSKNSQLCIGQSSFRINISMVEWGSLNHLVIFDMISYTNLIELIKALKSLGCLQVDEVVADSSQLVTCEPVDESEQLVYRDGNKCKPISLSLRELYIESFLTKSPKHLAKATWDFLEQSLPNLKHYEAEI